MQGLVFLLRLKRLGLGTRSFLFRGLLQGALELDSAICLSLRKEEAKWHTASQR